jgi:hypothetical protein
MDCRSGVQLRQNVFEETFLPGLAFQGLPASDFFLSRADGFEVGEVIRGCLLAAGESGQVESGKAFGGQERQLDGASRLSAESGISGWSNYTRGMDSAEELERRRRIVASGQTDFDRWRDLSNFSPLWDGRAEAAGSWIPPGSVVLDLGCGRMSLERYLPAGATYYPSDLYPRDQRTLLCNLNLDALPELPGIQVICALGVAEYLDDVPRFYREVRDRNVRFITSYHPHKARHVFDRPSLGWVNSLTFPEWIATIQDARFEITDLKLVSTGQYLLACDPV